MLTFTVHESHNPPSDRIDRAEGLIFVRDGFSWGGALLAPLWMLAHRLWLPLLGYVIAGVLIELVRESDIVASGWVTIAAVALNLLVGFEADTLRRWSLARRGWVTLGSVSGRNREDCERRFFDMWLPSQPVLAPASAAGGAAPGGRRSLSNALSGASG
jgi:hypothetical protein